MTTKTDKILKTSRAAAPENVQTKKLALLGFGNACEAFDGEARADKRKIRI